MNYGQTQTGGQNLSFYQRGFLTGGTSDPVSMNVYANEQWLKDAIGVSLANILISLGRVPANESGRATFLTVIRALIDEEATFNGTISTGRTLSSTQRAFVDSITDDPDAYRQIEAIGYWLDVQIVAEQNGGVTEHNATYTLLYAVDEVVRRVVGTHALI